MTGAQAFGGSCVSELEAAVGGCLVVAVCCVLMCSIQAGCLQPSLFPLHTTCAHYPTLPRLLLPLQVCDIAAIVSIAHEAGALVCVDNSFLTPLYQRPLDLGADISMTSGTKYIGGHGDTTLGMLAVRDPELGQQLYFLQNAEGAGLAPMDCWLALRGLKTVRTGGKGRVWV